MRFTDARDAVNYAHHILRDAGIESPLFEAQLLVALVMQVSRTSVIAGTCTSPDADQCEQLRRLLSARSVHRVPLAYLRGSQEFYGLPFLVTTETLVPRPETELLVDFACGVLANIEAPVVVDVGTGSGCIAVAILTTVPNSRAVCIDLSRGAIDVAWKNADLNGVSSRVRFMQSKLLSSLNGQFDLIVSNPPYIPSVEIESLQPEVRDHEPRLALDGGADGLSLIREIVESGGRLLCKGGALALECAEGQTDLIVKMFGQFGYVNVEVTNDLAGVGRMVSGRKSL